MIDKTKKTWIKKIALKLICGGTMMVFGGQLALASASQNNVSLTLNWNPSTSANLTGYRIYYGGASQIYTNSILVGNVTNAVVAGLAVGGTYYFGATTVDAAGNESVLSNEASYVVPAAAPTMTMNTQVKGHFGFAVSGTSGVKYVVQASSDLVHWIAVQTNLAPFAFAESNVAGFSQRFYRTYSLQ